MDNSTHFWLIRHGETQWNADRRLQGWLDVPLNAAGAAQAERLARFLHSDGFTPRIDAIVSSDLQRAVNTAITATQQWRLPVIRNEKLRERCYGIYEGQDWSRLRGADSDASAVNFNDPEQAIEGGESLVQFSDRIKAAFEELARLYRGKNVMVFSHGGVIDIVWRVAGKHALTVPRPEPILNTSINCFAIDEQACWHASEWAMTEHLDSPALDDVI